MPADQKDPIVCHEGASRLNRRTFLKGSAALASGIAAFYGTVLSSEAAAAKDPGLSVLGAREGYAPQIGSFVSMLTWMREVDGVITATKGLTTAELDHLSDPKPTRSAR